MVVACEICGKEFKYPSLLKQHKNAKKKCQPKEETEECLQCEEQNEGGEEQNEGSEEQNEGSEDIYDRGEGRIPYPRTAKERMNIIGLLMIKILHQCVDYRNENYVKENKETVGEAIRELTKKFEFELKDV